MSIVFALVATMWWIAIWGLFELATKNYTDEELSKKLKISLSVVKKYKKKEKLVEPVNETVIDVKKKDPTMFYQTVTKHKGAVVMNQASLEITESQPKKSRFVDKNCIHRPKG